jgi:transcriptional regulator with XRE-family HTH domain
MGKSLRTIKAKQEAIEILASNAKMSNRELAKQLGINKTTISAWMNDKDFIDAIYHRYMEVAGKYLPAVIQAQITEAMAGNTRAAELILKHFGKLQDRLVIEIESPFSQHLKKQDIQDAQVTESDAIEIGNNIEVENSIPLPPKDESANTPKRALNDRLKLKEAYDKVKYTKDINSRYMIRKRAKNVELKMLPSKRPTQAVRRRWLKKLFKTEQSQGIYYPDQDDVLKA